MLGILRALWAYRGFILGSVKREFQSKYRNSLLGAAWTVLNPLAMIVVYTVIFAQVMQAKLPGVDNTFAYSIYLCAGMLPWGLFAEIVGRAQNTFLENANLLKKLSFPRLCLPVVVVANAGINFAIIFGLFTAFLLVSGNFPGLPFLAVFPLLAILVLFAIGLGITLGVLNVFFRDVGQFFGIVLSFWYLAHPHRLSGQHPFRTSARHSCLEPHGSLWSVLSRMSLSPESGPNGKPSGWSHCLALCSVSPASVSSAAMPAKWWMNCNGRHHGHSSGQSLQAIRQPLVAAGRMGAAGPHPAPHSQMGAAGRLLHRQSRRSGRHHRHQRRRQEHPAQDDHRHHPAHQRQRSDDRPRGRPARTRHGVSSGFHRPAERRHGRATAWLQRRRNRRLMPEIEAFAEIGDYIDQPVRVYSSGMQMRLAFSVATAIRPDVLIVDEALSVGDAYFVHKSFSRIRQFREEGTTLLIVSHDKTAIQSICDRAILLNAGKLAMEGEPEAVMDYYNAMLADSKNQMVKQVVTDEGKIQTISGNGEVTLTDVALLDEAGKPIEMVAVGQQVSLHVKVTCNARVEDLVVGYMIKDRLGQPVFGTNTYHHKRKLQNLRGDESIEFNFDFQANLGPGTYSMSIALHADENHVGKNYEWRDHALVFNMINIDKDEFVGVAWIPPVVRCSV